jgi:N6-adenosine-specific RNA methylase IME4
MIDSVVTERQDGIHSSKPAIFRTLIEQMYDGPYLELFARERVSEQWACFGNDANLWHIEQTVRTA